MGQYKYAPKYVYDKLPYRTPGTAFVYGLRVIGGKQFRYVGSTVQPRHRLTSHFVAARTDNVKNQRLQEWLSANEGNVEMVILGKCDRSAVRKLEKDKARQLSALGHSLFNLKRPTQDITEYEADHVLKLMRERMLKVLDS